MSVFHPAPKALFQSVIKTGDPRWAEKVRLEAPSQKGAFVLAGYPDDEGIALNQGRPGAALGPDAIRSRFYKTSVASHQKNCQLVDLGNLSTVQPLADRHHQVAEQVTKALKDGHQWIGLGGGHDYGYADGLGFLNAQEAKGLKPLILNFDAHLDVRPTDKGLTSGTPFYRLLTEKNVPDFDFYEIGIQRCCNSQSHIEWLQDKGGKILFLDDLLLQEGSVLQSLMRTFAESMVRKRPVYISIDIDGFSSAFAPGASQSWPLGLSPMDVLPFLQIAQERWNIQVLGIYEVSPPLDRDECTVKLASQILHQFVRDVT